MARPRDPANSLYEAGPVRVVNRKPRGYRILWTEGKRQRERGANTLEGAKQIAHDEAARLWTEGGQLATADTTFAALVSAAIDPRHRDWTENWANRVERIARIHIIPQLGDLPARQITRQHLSAVLQDMALEGYSHDFMKHTRNVIKLAVDEGIQREVWDGSRNPLVGVTVPRSRARVEDGRPDLAMIPTDNQVEELVIRMASDRPVYGVMATVAAYTGVRWGELSALTVGSVDLGKQRLHVTRTCVESDEGRFQFRAPGKRNARARDVVLESPVSDVFRAWIADLDDDWETGPHFDGGLPERLLLSTRNGNPFRRSARGKVFWRHAGLITGWPTEATWHYLRHYCATRWIRLGVEVPTVSMMLGHRQVSTTYNWYVNVDSQALERAAKTLEGDL